MYEDQDGGKCIPYYIHRDEKGDELRWIGRGKVQAYMYESVASVAGNVIVWDSVSCGKQVWFKTGKRYEQVNKILSWWEKGGWHHVDDVGFTARNCPDKDKCYSVWAKHDSNKEQETLEGPSGILIKKGSNVMTETRGEWMHGTVTALWGDHTVSISYEALEPPAGEDLPLTPTDVKKKDQATRTGTFTKPLQPNAHKVITRYGGEWFRGTITDCWEDNTVSIAYEDGDTWRGPAAEVFHTDEEEQLEKMRRTMGAEDWCKLVGAPVVKKRVASMYVQFSPDPATDTKAEAYRTATDKLGAKTIKTGDKVMTRYLGQWCHGTVSAIYTDDTLTVKYDDGDSWRGAPKYVFYPDEKPALDTAQKEMNAGDWCKLVGAACFAKLLGPAWITYEVTRFVHDYATHD
jgi:hypothetical protein